jgi:ankyrin repeat protein
VDAVNEAHDTQLHIAADCGTAEMINLFTSYGANQKIKNSRGLTAYDVIKGKYPSLLR